MGDRRHIGGQSLVEFSLVFSAVFLTVILMLEFLFIARTKLVLGFTADRVARVAAAPGILGAIGPLAVQIREYAMHFGVGPAWGTPMPAHISQENLPPGPDYPFEVVSPLDTPPRLSVVDISYVVFPKTWFGNLFSVPILGAHVELPVEPEVPET